MNKAIYISGIAGILLLVIGTLGIFLEFAENKTIFAVGLFLIFLVFLPLVILRKNQHNRKIDGIIQSYRKKPKGDMNATELKTTNKGWNMNNSSYRERKSGLSWGGGNISAAQAKRGSRRSFLK